MNIVTKLLKDRNKGFNLATKSTRALLDLGVKFGEVNPDGETSYEVPENYLPYFTFNLEEYEWTAIYEDKTSLKQFAINKQNTFKDIDQSKLSKIQYISNFEYPTDGLEKRVIASLDWKTGKFDFLNGIIDMTERGILAQERKPEKLILFARKQFGQTIEVGVSAIRSTREVYMYKRYYLGYKTASKEKVLICLSPDMKIRIEQ